MFAFVYGWGGAKMTNITGAAPTISSLSFVVLFFPACCIPFSLFLLRLPLPRPFALPRPHLRSCLVEPWRSLWHALPTILCAPFVVPPLGTICTVSSSLACGNTLATMSGWALCFAGGPGPLGGFPSLRPLLGLLLHCDVPVALCRSRSWFSF